MKTVKENIHRGKILQAAVKQSERNVDYITSRAGYSRGAYYTHIRRPDLPMKILQRYAKVLRYDFSADIPEFNPLIAEEAETPYLTTPETLQEAISQRDYYIKKYIELLEEYRKLQLGKK